MLVIGSVFVDVKGYAPENYVPEGRNIGSVQTVAGGVCRNVAENLSKLGMPVQFVSMVDGSAFGREVLDALTLSGVNVTHTIQAPNGIGMWLAILARDGNLIGSISRQPDFSALEAYLDKCVDALVAATDGMVLEFDMTDSIAEKVMSLAIRHRKPVFSIVGNMGVILRHSDYLQHVSCFICNELEAGRLFELNVAGYDPERMLALLKKESTARRIPRMVVTMGPQGSVFVDNTAGDSGICQPIDVKVVDTTGAGDAFFSAAVAALMQGKPLRQAALAGTQLASKTLGVRGSCA